jgi:acyl carrier protein
MEQTRDRIRRFILDNFYVPDPGRLGDDVSLIGTGIVDSTGMLEIIELVEGEMGVEVGDRDILPDNFDTIGRITAYVERKRAS